MSRVDERLEGTGSFTINLTEDTAPSILAELTLDPTDPRTLGAAVVVVTDAHVDPRDLGDTSSTTFHPLYEVARWCGILTQITGRRRQLAGSGLGWLLGTPDGIGAYFSGSPQAGTGDHTSRTLTMTAASYIEWMALGGTRTTVDANSVTIGGTGLYDVDTPANGPTIPYYAGTLASRRELVDGVCRAAGWVYYIGPDLVLHAGAPASLFPDGPRAIVAEGLLPDPGWITVGASPGGIDWDEDMAGWANQLVAVTEVDGTPRTWAYPNETSGMVNQYRGPDLNRLLHAAEEPREGDENALAWAARAIDLAPGARQIRRQVPIKGALHDHGAPLRVGEPIWVYAPDVGLVDTANEVPVTGQTLHPVELPLHGIEWPIVDGMGVYIVGVDRTDPPNYARRVLDLTPYVVPDEDGTASLTVGAPAWTL